MLQEIEYHDAFIISSLHYLISHLSKEQVNCLQVHIF
jgi:hypothetical protein